MLALRIDKKVESLAEAPIGAVLTDPKLRKFEHEKALGKINQDVKRILEEEDYDVDCIDGLPKMIDTLTKKVFLNRIIKKDSRVDGRHPDEVRPLCFKSSNRTELNGSSLFAIGDTQVQCVVTQRSPIYDEARFMGTWRTGEPEYDYMLRPFMINEEGKEGPLIERALVIPLPKEVSFPYIVRVNTEVKDSDGSTSMTTVCAGSIALMEAGIPLTTHVAGITVGVVTEVDPFDGKISDYHILTDLSSLEEHLVDVIFNVAGTRKGVTAAQLVVNHAGVPLDIICQCLGPALKGRHHILNHMEQEINAPCSSHLDDWDRVDSDLVVFELTADSLERLVGPDGARKRQFERETGGRIVCIVDDQVTIAVKNETGLREVRKKEAESYLGA
ncbi:polyribonucleotide nucleotidyltransferase 2, mitochondrial-like isoform X1 [Papaver somniferum]|uniref:polyribonucleotide nucleotidyltransferase 2, mitochondrial-like isoform X1 n=1 Tax=Papaver somniferum TaxID=3469 RepID=UPI000E7021DC|nr:polyribonucleotide nucleotidyltransferase 2, mitochondrial-like isoform X1 [Papaver somniferum]XP_026421608.1 polyribonucleotide nucleotidyltransferase 2, mitochondrial-like isoform X1 [Papaver somniferum]